MHAPKKVSFRPRQLSQSLQAHRPLRKRSMSRALNVAAVLSVFFLISLTVQLVQSVYNKRLGTDFHTLCSFDQTTSYGLLPTHPIRHYSSDTAALDIDDKYTYIRDLGHGFQGQARLYNDTDTGEIVVIKTFLDGIRNRLPPYLHKLFKGRRLDWPTEIPATILLAGMLHHGQRPNATYAHRLESVDVLPALDYFLTPSESGQASTWHLVTPYMSLGILSHLAKRIGDKRSQSPFELDILLRPAFNRVLAALASLHAKGYCHNDIKLDNVFALNFTHWLIGDLGNVREIHHPYTSSDAWMKANQWRDCRANDVRRALKTYLAVLRAASSDWDEFDDEFYLERQAWSNLYWEFMRRPVHAEEQLERQRKPSLDTMLPAVWTSEKHRKWPKDLLHTAITRELLCTSLKQSWREWWRMGGLWPRFVPEMNPIHPYT